MTPQYGQALLFPLALLACTSSATVGRLAEVDTEAPDAAAVDASALDASALDASARDGARTDGAADAIPDASAFEPVADSSMSRADANDDSRSEASVPEASVGCVDDRGCPSGRMCSLGACVQCVVDEHCVGREEPRCDARGRCVECTSTAECPLANQVCAPWGECELTCTRDTQCLAMLRCDENFRVCLECVEDADCSGSGEFCDEGVCARCAGNPDCPR